MKIWYCKICENAGPAKDGYIHPLCGQDNIIIADTADAERVKVLEQRCREFNRELLDALDEVARLERKLNNNA